MAIDKELDVGARVTVKLNSSAVRKSKRILNPQKLVFFSSPLELCISKIYDGCKGLLSTEKYGLKMFISEGGGGGKQMRGEAVAPSIPRSVAGLYWGYTVRLADTFSAVFTNSPHQV